MHPPDWFGEKKRHETLLALEPAVGWPQSNFIK
jgi:hypothetical protein